MKSHLRTRLSSIERLVRSEQEPGGGGERGKNSRRVFFRGSITRKLKGLSLASSTGLAKKKNFTKSPLRENAMGRASLTNILSSKKSALGPGQAKKEKGGEGNGFPKVWSGVLYMVELVGLAKVRKAKKKTQGGKHPSSDPHDKRGLGGFPRLILVHQKV